MTSNDTDEVVAALTEGDAVPPEQLAALKASVARDIKANMLNPKNAAAKHQSKKFNRNRSRKGAAQALAQLAKDAEKKQGVK